MEDGGQSALTLCPPSSILYVGKDEAADQAS
jgi:hypothetical protein